MTLTIHETLEQGSDEWLQARCGKITASEMSLILTPTLKVADNDKTKKHAFTLAAQRLTNYVEPHYISDSMIRGQADEIKARDAYSENYAPVQEIGGMERDFGSFSIWYSPDGLVGEDGCIECKSRMAHFQIQTFVDWDVPPEYKLQVQTALLVSGRDWVDYISYSSGLPVAVIRVYPDETVHHAILSACEAFEEKVQRVMQLYQSRLDELGDAVIMTEREIEQEMII